MRYFAYGSNMLTERLRRRVGDARVIGPCRLAGWRLAFWKNGQDGSSKCDVARDEGAVVHGVFFDVPEAERPTLDAVEGPGYERRTIVVVCGEAEMESEAYFARPAFIDPNLPPYAWYHRLVMAGAIQHGLPAEYVEFLEATEAAHDPEPHRAGRLEAIEVLETAGFGRLMPVREG